MKVLLVHPGADVSVSDVHEGVRAGLLAAGVSIVDYNLSQRTDRAYKALLLAWRTARQRGPCVKPNYADAIYKASCDLWERWARHRPQWIVLVSGMFFHPDALYMLRDTCPDARIAVIFTESPYDDDKQLAFARWTDVAFTNDRASLDAFRGVQPQSHYLPAAYHPDIHCPDAPMPEGVPAHDVVFVGSPWQERVALLEAVDWTGIDLGLYGTWDFVLEDTSPLRRFVRGGVTPNEVTSALYRRAAIGLNWHRTMRGLGVGQRTVEHVTTGESMNPRCYELAACGAFFLSDPRPELVEVFGAAVPTFTDASSLTTQLRRWLADPEGRRAAAAATRAAIAPHSWALRARTMLNHLRSADTRSHNRRSPNVREHLSR